MRTRVGWAMLLAACAAGRPSVVPEERPLPAEAAPATQVADLNARARRGAVKEVIGGIEVSDPYRALEADSPETRAWIDAQSERTERTLAALADPGAAARLEALLDIGRIDAVALGGGRAFVTKREGEREQPALYVREGGVLADLPLVDPLAWGERAALDWSFPSPGGRHVAFGISENGDERAVLQVVEVAGRARLADRIDHAKWSSVSWLHDESGFYYTRYPREGETGFDAAEPDTYFPRVYFHRLGADPAADPLVFGSAVKTDFPFVAVGDDDRWIVVGNFRGWTASDLYLFDRGAKPGARADAPDAAHPLRPVITGEDKLTTGAVHRGSLYLATNLDAPKKRIVRVAPERAAERAAWRDIVPEGAGTIEDWAPAGDRIAVHAIEDVHSRLRVYDLDGRLRGEIALPARGSLDALAADTDSGRIAYVFSSFFHPPALYEVAPAAGELAPPTLLHEVAHDLDTSAYEQSQAWVTSADGTRVNVHYVHRKGVARDGENPVLLYGYGGFDVSLLPEFTRTALYFIERGGIYAVANLRGGGELGEAWHRAGMLGEKKRVFEDFEAVIRWFSESGLSRPSRIGIMGGSNGGLLVGAMLTRVPDRFGAAVASVGLYDMMRYPEFPPAALWVTEYGDPNDPEAARWLAAYSPYHNVKDGTRYPAALVETADHDTRVHWAHSTKFAARLQEAQAGDAPIHFYMERQQGHGRGTRQSDLVRRYVRRYAFLEAALGM